MSAEILAISTDNLAGAENVAQRVGIEFPVLYTSGDSTVPKDYNVYDLHGDGLASPAVFIINPQGEITWKYISTTPYRQVLSTRILNNLP